MFLRDIGAEPADTGENRLRHEKISRARKAVFLDVFLEMEREHDLDRFRQGRLLRLTNSRDHLPTDIIKPLERRHSVQQPIPIGHTIGVDEGKNSAARYLDSGVAGVPTGVMGVRDESDW